MLVFNCTKAAADFFTITRQGEKVSYIEPAPHKTIAESISTPVFPDDVDATENDGFQWQWVVHCVSIKRKKYLLVMDYHSRICITLLAGKKGDQYAFLNSFDAMLKATFHNLARQEGVDEVEIAVCIDHYDNKVNTCAFHARSDKSVQAHINDVLFRLESQCNEGDMLIKEADLLLFNVFTSEYPRKSKNRKEYFFPKAIFVHTWQQQSLADSNVDMSNVIHLDQYRKL